MFFHLYKSNLGSIPTDVILENKKKIKQNISCLILIMPHKNLLFSNKETKESRH